GQSSDRVDRAGRQASPAEPRDAFHRENLRRDEESLMRAVAVFPGRRGSAHLAELPRPKVTDVPNGRGVRVEVLRVGVDGTDREIQEAEYGEAPAGETFLVLGHESLGRVVEVGPAVTELKPGDLGGAMGRRPGVRLHDPIRMPEPAPDDTSLPRGSR